MTTITQIQGFAALGRKNRYELMDALHKHGRLTVSDLAGYTGQLQPTVSKGLKELAMAGLVTFTQDGNKRIYSIRRSRLNELRFAMEQMLGLATPVAYPRFGPRTERLLEDAPRTAH